MDTSTAYQSQEKFKKCTKVIIDADPGADDAHAIVMGFYLSGLSGGGVDVLGITTVSGNSDIHNVTRNAQIILEVCQ